MGLILRASHSRLSKLHRIHVAALAFVCVPLSLFKNPKCMRICSVVTIGRSWRNVESGKYKRRRATGEEMADSI